MKISQVGTAPTRLRLRRISLGLRLRDVKSASGLAENTISRLERGEQQPTRWQLERLARVFGISAEQVEGELQSSGLSVGDHGSQEHTAPSASSEGRLTA